ncbi:MAG: protein kinase [Verrucomicrobia bacterium]|nr:protein kinase [Verrucomicrobiota bacterium]
MNSGTRVGPFEIVRLLGRGGMGEVYLARDTRLGRDVALKRLPGEFAQTPERLRRFEQEAKTLASVNHPNILSIFEVGIHEGAPYLVSELLEGETLRERLQRGPIPERKAMELTVQIVQGLAAAHDKGVVHRDLKPENVFVTKDERVKILDFGLAKLVGAARACERGALKRSDALTLERSNAPDAEDAPTLIETTEPGRVLGTVGYMSPEQVRGEPADHRSDFFSLGAILFEMLTGQRAFQRGTAAETMTAILNEEPAEMASSNRALSPGWRRIVSRCLEKSPERRFQSATDLAFAIEALSDSRTEAKAKAASKAPLPGWAWTAAATVVGLAVVSLLVRKPAVPADSAKSSTETNTAAAPALVANDKSVAVLAFADLSPEKDSEYFSDGISEELLNVLAKVPGLRVSARTSAFYFKGKQAPMAEIAKQLNVAYLVEGSVRKSGDRVRITAQLINAADGFHLWSETYERDMTNIFAIQDDIARAIVARLKVTLAGPAGVSSPKRHRADVEAYELYLKGRFHIEELTEPEVNLAITHFQQALARQPDYALAYVGLATAYTTLSYFGYVSPASVEPQWKAAAAKGLELDDSLVEAHAVLAEIGFFCEWDWTGVERACRRVLALDPSYARAHRTYAFLLSTRERHSEAIAEAVKALELDPLSAHMKMNAGAVFFFARDYDRALATAEEIISVNPDYFMAHRLRGSALFRQGRTEEGIAAIEKAAGVMPVPARLADLAFKYGRVGRKSDARKMLDQLLLLAKQQYVPAHTIAGAYDGVGDMEQANVWMNKAIEAREGTLVFVKVLADDITRANPHYPEWLKKIGLDR